ncbi:MAG: FdrA protein [Solirubrobacteraceae bacterium]|nr:FdrA protein [Solirubrobacteraceae bacterium]
MSWDVRTLPDRYADSVRLMGIARALRQRDGISRCEIGMGTPANLTALAEMGADAQATPGDVVIAVEGDGDAAQEAFAEAERLLSSGDGAGGAAGGAAPARPRSLAAATASLADANVALVSVPGEYAALEAHRALTRGLHVFLFSDHVGIEDEVALKRRGAELGLLVMGPGCGTAMLGGVGLGFANEVAAGSVGIVAAAGTGAQEVACLVAEAGAGVSQIIGVGGRDLSEEVGGLAFRQALAMLGDDDRTETVLLVSKPPAPAVVRALGDALPQGKRAVAAFVGLHDEGGAYEVHDTLEAGALAAVGASPADVSALERAVDEARDRARGRRVLGLYSGGSLAHEAVTILEETLGPVAGNVSSTGGDEDGSGHTVLDLGEEEYTQGRPHPMVDLELRRGMIEDAADDESLGCLLLDVVLGHGAHPDPAGELAAAVAKVAERAIVLVRVCGTAQDPQDAGRQAAALEEAGALVAPSNAAAVRLAVRAVLDGDG